MADDQVFEQSFEIAREIWQLRELSLQHLQFDDHVTEQLAARAVGERPVVSKLVNLADIVQERARQQQIPVDLRIIPGDQVAGTKQRNHVVEQSADESMVQRLGGGRDPIALCNFRVGQEQFDQRLQVSILEGSDEVQQSLPEFVDVLGSLGQVIRKIYFRILHAAKFVDGELESILVLVDQAFDLEEVVLLEDVDELLDVVPHLRFDLAGTVTEGKRQIRLTCFLGLHLFRHHYKSGSDDLVFLLRTIADEEFFHEPRIWEHQRLARLAG